MSKLEERIQQQLAKNKLRFELHKPVPLETYPWQTNRSKTAPKCDIYLTDFDLYIEIKGFMTYRAVSKLSYLSRQDFKYYIFQGTEFQWNPKIDTYLEVENNRLQKESSILNSNIEHQLQELIHLKLHSNFINNISEITLKRLKDYIGTKVNEYTSWNNEWY